MGKRGEGEEVRRGSGSTSSLSSSCCRRALACWAQPWPCAEIPAVYAAQVSSMPVMCQLQAGQGNEAHGSIWTRSQKVQRASCLLGPGAQELAKPVPLSSSLCMSQRPQNPLKSTCGQGLVLGTEEPGKSPDSAGQAHTPDNSQWLA